LKKVFVRLFIKRLLYVVNNLSKKRQFRTPSMLALVLVAVNSKYNH